MDLTEMLVKAIKNGDMSDVKNFVAGNELLKASENGDLEKVKELVDNRADVNFSDKYGWTPLIFAVERNHLSVVELLLLKGADVNHQTNDGWTPLICSAINGNKSLSEFLISKGADVNLKTKKGQFLEMSNLEINDELIRLCRDRKDGKVEIEKIQELLSKPGIDINCRDFKGRTPLYFACSRGNLFVVELLLKKGADINLADSEGSSPLTVACLKNHFPVIDFLVRNGADVNLKNSFIEKIQKNILNEKLLKAAKEENLDEVEKCLDGGADVNWEDEEGKTTLILSSSKGNLLIVKFLCSNGADVNYQTVYGWSAVCAAAYNQKMEVLEFLIRNGADVNLKNLREMSAVDYQKDFIEKIMKNMKEEKLLWFSGNGDLEKVKELVDSGTDVNCRDHNENSPLIMAAINKKFPVIEFLVRKGADVNLKNRFENSGMNYQKEFIEKILSEMKDEMNEETGEAAGNGDLEKVKDLIEKGAYVNFYREHIGHPLYRAAKGGHLPVVEFLILKGAKINQQTAILRQTALYAAAEGGHLPVVEFLVRKGADVKVTDLNGRSALYYKKGFIEKILNDILNETNEELLKNAKEGNLDRIKELVKNGANVDYTDFDCWTALMMAADGGHLPVVEFLITEKNINHQTKIGWTPLTMAAYKGHLPVVEFLVRKGADVNKLTVSGLSALTYQKDFIEKILGEMKKDKIDDETVKTMTEMNGDLLKACFDGQIEKVKELLNNGADVNWEGEGGKTPLNISSKKGHFLIVKLLVSKGANINRQNIHRWTAVSAAAYHQQLEVLEFLIRQGGDVNLKVMSGGSALTYQKDFIEKILGEMKKDKINDETNEELLKNAKYGKLDRIKELLEKGANVNHEDFQKRTALVIAAWHGHLDIVEFLISKGANVNHIDVDGWSALIYAANCGYGNIIELLVRQGADVNTKHRGGQSALHYQRDFILKVQKDIEKEKAKEKHKIFVQSVKQKNIESEKDIEKEKHMCCCKKFKDSNFDSFPDFCGDKFVQACEKGNLDEILHYKSFVPLFDTKIYSPKEIMEFRKMCILAVCQLDNKSEHKEEILEILLT